MKVPRLVAALVLLAALGACGKHSNGPSGPSGTPTLTGVSVTPATDLLTIKSTVTFTATANFSDGTSQTVQGTWGTDAPTIATVEGGRVTGVAPGLATVFADYQGQRGTRTVRVVPDYQGHWSGDWSVTGCTGDGDFSDICSVYVIGDLYALTLVASQTRDTITGTTDFGDNLPGPVTGTIAANGHLTVSGTYTITIEDLTIELTVGNWDTLTLDNQRMTGHLSVTGRAVGVQGSFTVTGDLHVVSKTSTVPSRLPADRPAPLTGIVEALRGR
jgi:hypothetical protein